MASKIMSFSTDVGEDVYIVRNDDGAYDVYATGDIKIATLTLFTDAYNVFCAHVHDIREKVLRRETGI